MTGFLDDTSFDIPWDLSKRGMKDKLRHDKKIRDAIKNNIRDIIVQEDIIRYDGKKKIKISLKFLDRYHFRYGKNKKQMGVGQSEGDEGDIIAKDPGKSDKPGRKAGDQPDDLTYDIEMPLEDLIKLMLEDMDLPWLEEKEKHSIKSETVEYNDISNVGQLNNLDKLRTVMENMKRNAAKDGKVKIGDFIDEDCRYNTYTTRVEYESNACIQLLMDRSYSMTEDKIYVTKAFFWYIVQFLRFKYDRVDIVFIAHDTEAHMIDNEEDFFKLVGGGGTKCSSAYKIALDNVLTKYPSSRWNNYIWHFTDGENWEEDDNVCKDIILELLEHCNMIGYCEVNMEDDFWFTPFGGTGWTTLYDTLKDIEHPRFIAAGIEGAEGIYDLLKKFLGASVENESD